MGKVTVELNDRLMDTAITLFKGKTKSEIITLALVELVDKYEQKNLYDLFYSDEVFIAESYDYRAKRGSSSKSSVDILVENEEEASSDGVDDLASGADASSDGEDSFNFDRSASSIVEDSYNFSGSNSSGVGNNLDFSGGNSGDFGNNLEFSGDTSSGVEDSFRESASSGFEDGFTVSGESFNDSFNNSEDNFSDSGGS